MRKKKNVTVISKVLLTLAKNYFVQHFFKPFSWEQ